MTADDSPQASPRDGRGVWGSLTPNDRRRGLEAVRSGQVISLARPIQTTGPPGTGMWVEDVERLRFPSHPRAGALVETHGVRTHGHALTHLDALSHVWEDDVLYGGVRVDEALVDNGVAALGVEHLAREGYVGRGVLLDVAALRPDGYVAVGEPVSADELQRALEVSGTEIQRRDAVVVHAGRTAWERRHGQYGADGVRPGLDPSCLEFIVAHGAGVLVWDMLDCKPHTAMTYWSVHRALCDHGLPIVDNAELTLLASRCAELGQPDFLLVLAPLPITHASGSPVNPLAVL